jgi:hypothetical protein
LGVGVEATVETVATVETTGAPVETNGPTATELATGVAAEVTAAPPFRVTVAITDVPGTKKE